MVGPLLDPSLLDHQASFFVITTMTNSYGALHPSQFENPTNRMCEWVTSNVIVASRLSKYVKFMEMTIVMVLDMLRKNAHILQ
jgi:hypothetical protein